MEDSNRTLKKNYEKTLTFHLDKPGIELGYFNKKE